MIGFFLLFFLNLAVGQSDDAFAEFDTDDDTVIISEDDNDIEVFRFLLL